MADLSQQDFWNEYVYTVSSYNKQLLQAAITEPFPTMFLPDSIIAVNPEASVPEYLATTAVKETKRGDINTALLIRVHNADVVQKGIYVTWINLGGNSEFDRRMVLSIIYQQLMKMDNLHILMRVMVLQQVKY